MKFPVALLCLFSAGFLVAQPARAIINGQLDTFEDGTSDHWVYGFGDLTVVPTGGPGGANDHYLEIGGSAIDGAPLSKVVGYNASQWTGNFIGAGVNAIEMDLKAFSIDPTFGSALKIRIAFRSATGPRFSVGASGYVSSTNASIPADGQWHHAVFFLSSLVPINSVPSGNPPEPLATFLTHPAELRIMHLVNPNAVTGDTVKAVLGVDNIHAFTNVSISSTTKVSASTVRLQGKGVANTTYTIQASPNLVGPFVDIGFAVSVANGTFQYDDTSATGLTQRFYRVKTP